MGKSSDEELESRVRSLAGRGPARTPEVAAELDALLIGISDPQVRERADRRRPWWRRRPIVGATIGVIVAVGVVGVPAAAVSWLAHTGVFGGSGTETDASEWIGVDADDAPQAIRDLYPTWMALPAGTSRADAEHAVDALYTRSVAAAQEEDQGGHVITQATDIRRMFESYGRCSWYRSWIDAYDAHDSSARAAASSAIEDAATWPATVSTDGGGVVEHLREVARSASRGDREAVATAYGVDLCAPFAGNLDR